MLGSARQRTKSRDPPPIDVSCPSLSRSTFSPAGCAAWAWQSEFTRNPWFCTCKPLPQRRPLYVCTVMTLFSFGAQQVGLLTEAQDAFLSAVALEPNFVPAFVGLGNIEGARGDIRRVRNSGNRKKHPRRYLKIHWIMLACIAIFSGLAWIHS